MDRQFGVLAQYYDKLNYNADYKKVADYIEDIFRLYDKRPELVLDLACGTGSLTLELARRGYDMTGLD
jgi:2-polyprenyl-3-methyl-5-hydroxy-6-metoxy-1,4-benzoquinol methylase